MKKKYYCKEPNCDNEVSEKDRRCMPCASKGERNPMFGKRGKETGNYIDNRTKTKHYCIKCKVNEICLVNFYYGSRMCKTCAEKNKHYKLNFILTESFLRKEYVNNKKSITQIAKLIGCNRTAIEKRLDTFKIKKRSFLEEMELNKGENNANYKGGKIKVKCNWCKEELKVSKWRLKKYKHVFCNTECKAKWQVENMKGKNNSLYVNGLGNEPYPLEFNNQLKESIRKRDNYQCQNCSMTEEEHLIVFGGVLDVHHIDYNKQNCKKDNLTTLCRNCNLRANYNRKYWTNYFEEKMRWLVKSLHL